MDAKVFRNQSNIIMLFFQIPITQNPPNSKKHRQPLFLTHRLYFLKVSVKASGEKVFSFCV